jgi:S-adenosylmethionine:tRNA ribosyltransferase-isomerase
MRISEFDYKLPEELIAHFPAERRDHSSLMVLNKQNQTIDHKKFFDIVDLFDENDLLVMNNTKVIPARLIGKKSTGANIEVFLLKNIADRCFEVLIKPSKRIKPDTIIYFSDELSAKAIGRAENDKWIVELDYKGDFEQILNKVGNIPLPPYISRQLTDETIKNLDFERYQTVYAQKSGSVAAPTAGLHFTSEILEKLEQKGVKICYVTLNVGLGTFKPVKADNILDHQMDSEQYEISEETACLINNAFKKGNNIVAVGTTTVRTLESAFAKCGKIEATNGESKLFIYPGYKFQVVNKLITNFHLPKSTLLMLVSALAGKEFVFSAYNQAIKNNYRFYSYGDCMFIS